MAPPKAPGRAPAARPPTWRLIGVIFGLGIVATGVVVTRRASVPDRPPVLLITVDTLRADRLGCYGYRAAATPTMDGLAGRGVRFATGIAHAPLTTPSHASMLTGLTPPRHGIRDNGGFLLPDAIPTLAEGFRIGGYRTAAFVSGFPLDRRFGLARGFETYDDRLPRGDDRRRADYVERSAAETTAAALRWLGGLGATPPPWFVWLHYFDPHAPYEPPVARGSDPYDGEVAFVDAELGRLLGHLEKDGTLARAVVLLTADHGESFGEHGEETHGVFVYDSTLRVPWIVAGRGLRAGTVSRVVARGADVMPTLLELAGLPVAPGLDGRSLVAAAKGHDMEDAPTYVESLFAQRHFGWAPLTGWRTAAWKLIDAPRPELYALEADTGEMTDRSREKPDIMAVLREPLEAARRAAMPAATATVTAEARERLGALGYLSAGAPASGGSGRDPKDGITLVNRVERAVAEARSDPGHAASELAAVLAQDPRLTLARRYRAIALAAAGQARAALGELDALAAQGPLSAEDLVLKAECLHLAGQAPEALRVLDAADRLDTRSPDPHLTRARVLIALGRPDEAKAAYERALERAPSHTAALRGLGDLAQARGDLAAAASYYRRVLESDARDARSLLQLGLVEARAGRLDAALALLRQAVEVDPGRAEALLALGGALAKTGRPGEAVPVFERAIEAGGRSRLALNGLGFARLEAGDVPGALQALRASLAVEPGQADVADVVRRLTATARP